MRLPAEIITKRLRLRRPTPADLDFLLALYSDPQVVRYLSFKPLERREQAHAMLDHFLDVWERYQGELSTGTPGHLYVIEDGPGRVAGTFGVRCENHGYELSYALARSAWGHGYVPEAITAVSDWLLEHGAWRVFATCHVDNRGSQRALEKAGFEREGRMRRYFTFPNLGPEPADGYL
ncbi:GNAT family N-acetyltransferase, partial [Oceanithermus sp.]